MALGRTCKESVSNNNDDEGEGYQAVYIAGGASIHPIHLIRRCEDRVIVQKRYWGTFGMTRDTDFVHPWVEIKVWQPYFPQRRWDYKHKKMPHEPNDGGMLSVVRQNNVWQRNENPFFAASQAS